MTEIPKKKKTQKEIDDEMLRNKNVRQASLGTAAAVQPSPKQYDKIISGASPEAGSTVLVGNKKGAEAISAEEYKKRQEKPKKKSIIERMVRMTRRMR